MRTILLLSVLLLTPIFALGQDRVTIKGRIINEQGEAVEYVQVGIPKLQIGTISTADGHFEITVPCDTLAFFHVSYQTGSHIVSGPADDLVIVLHENELPPAVFIGGNTKEKYLLRSGTKILGNKGILEFVAKTDSTKGVEIGSVAKPRKPFLIKEIQFSILRNTIPVFPVEIQIKMVLDHVG